MSGLRRNNKFTTEPERGDEVRDQSSSNGLGASASGANDDFAELIHLSFVVHVGKLVEDLVASLGLHVTVVLESFTANAASKIYVLLHDCDS